MTLEQKLKEANYVRRNEDGKCLEKSCGNFCDYSEFVNIDKPDSYRVCKKLGIRVGDNDSCKYFSDKEFSQALDTYAADLKKESSTNKPTYPKKKKKHTFRKVLIFVVAVFLMCWFVFILYCMQQ